MTGLGRSPCRLQGHMDGWSGKKQLVAKTGDTAAGISHKPLPRDLAVEG